MVSRRIGAAVIRMNITAEPKRAMQYQRRRVRVKSMIGPHNAAMTYGSRAIAVAEAAAAAGRPARVTRNGSRMVAKPLKIPSGILRKKKVKVARGGRSWCLGGGSVLGMRCRK